MKGWGLEVRMCRWFRFRKEIRPSSCGEGRNGARRATSGSFSQLASPAASLRVRAPQIIIILQRLSCPSPNLPKEDRQEGSLLATNPGWSHNASTLLATTIVSSGDDDEAQEETKLLCASSGLDLVGPRSDDSFQRCKDLAGCQLTTLAA